MASSSAATPALAVGLVDAARLQDPRYTDYARAEASLGINGVVLNNVNAKADSLTAEYIAKAARAGRRVPALRHQVYLSARFSAPRDIGGLPTADPLDPRCARGGRPRPTRSTARSPTSAGSWSRPTAKGQPGRRTTAAPTPTAPTCSPPRSRRTAAS
jgi:alpha-glucuronidase